MNCAIANGIINEDTVLAQIQVSQQEKYVNEHLKRYSIWYNESQKKWITYLPDTKKAEGRRKLRRNTRQELDKAVYEFYKEAFNSPTVEEVFYGWIDWRINKYEDLQQQSVMRYVNEFKRFLHPTTLAAKQMKDIREKELVDFIRSFSASKIISSKRRSNVLTILKGTFQYGYENGFTTISYRALKDNYDIRLHKRGKNKVLPGEDIFLDEEVKKLKDYIISHKNDIELLGILLVIYTGLRVGELAALKWSDIDIQKHILCVSRTEIQYKDHTGHTVIDVRESTKGSNGWRTVVISDYAIQVLDEIHAMNPSGEYLFMKAEKRIHANAWTKRLPRLCAKLGIGDKVPNTDRVNGKSMHKLRKYYASKLIESGLDPIFITMQMGHMDIGTSYNYYYRNTRSIEDTVNKVLPALDTL